MYNKIGTIEERQNLSLLDVKVKLIFIINIYQETLL